MFRDVFQLDGGTGKRLSDVAMKEIAFRIMEKIADMGGQAWDPSVAVGEENFIGKPRRIFVER